VRFSASLRSRSASLSDANIRLAFTPCTLLRRPIAHLELVGET
jgi:hypothetical protein